MRLPSKGICIGRQEKWRKRFIYCIFIIFGIFGPGVAAFATTFLISCTPAWAAELHHYVFFNLDRERIHEPSFLETKAFDGAQIKYTWKQLEPEQDKYDFAMIQSDLDFLKTHGKRLFIQLQDVTFDPKTNCVPQYLTREAKYHGGVAQEYTDTSNTAQGCVARRWDAAVQERYAKLLSTLGQQFDGKIEGLASMSIYFVCYDH